MSQGVLEQGTYSLHGPWTSTALYRICPAEGFHVELHGELRLHWVLAGVVTLWFPATHVGGSTILLQHSAITRNGWHGS